MFNRFSYAAGICLSAALAVSDLYEGKLVLAALWALLTLLNLAILTYDRGGK